MKVTTVQILDRGVVNKERLYFKALSTFNLSYLLAIESTYLTAQSVSNGSKRSYWFPPKDIKPGDHIILFTGPGTNGESIHTDNAKIYWFHWNLKETIWNQPTSCALIMEITFWQATQYLK